MALIVVVALVAAGTSLYRQTLSAPLLKAVKRQDADAVASLLRRGAPPDAAEDGLTALTLSLTQGVFDTGSGIDNVTSSEYHGCPESRERIALSLLKAGADPNRTPPGVSNLYLALDAPSLPVVKAMLTHGADPNGQYSNTPLLMKAVMDDAQLYATGKEEMPVYTQALLTAGADARVHHPFLETKTPSTVDAMIARGIWFFEELPLIVAVRYAGSRQYDSLLSYKRRGNAALIDTLLAHGAIIDARDHNGHTALSIAAAQGDLEDVRFLLARGADPTIGDRQGRTPLQDAREAGAKELARARASNESAMPSTPQRPMSAFERLGLAVNHKMNDEADIKGRYGAVEKLLLRPEYTHGR